MSTDNRALVERLIKAFEAKGLDAALACFAEDALLFDPHYPTPEMRGKAAIRQGFEFIFGIVQQPGFSIHHFWAGDQDGALEMDTHHVLGDGTEVRFPQVFVLEIADGLIRRLQAYVPYPPPAPPAGASPPAGGARRASPPWRATVENPHTGERWAIASPRRFVVCL